MVVIVIMAVLAAAATPIFAGYVKKARAAEHLSECRAIYVAAQSCLEEAFLKAGEGTVTVEDLDMERLWKMWRSFPVLAESGPERERRGAEALPEPFPFTWKTEGRSRLYTAVVFHGEGSDWIFDTVDGTYTEA